MPEPHELTDLVDPLDLELPVEQQRRIWLRNHAFGLAFGATLVLATVLVARVMILESRHATMATHTAAVSEATSVPEAAAQQHTSASAPADSATTTTAEDGALGITVSDAEAPVERTPTTLLVSRNEGAPQDAAPPGVEPKATETRPEVRTPAPRQTPRRTAPQQPARRVTSRQHTPPRAIDADAVPTRSVEKDEALPAVEAQDARSGTLTVQVRPWGSLFINERLVNREVSNRYQTRLEAGTYPVKVVHPVLGTWKGIAKVEAGREVAVFVNFNKQ